MNADHDGASWGCPFCSLVVDEEEDRAMLARRLFETHLDVHMARRDPLIASASRAA